MRILKLSKLVPGNYSPPNRRAIANELLDLNYIKRMEKYKASLNLDGDIFGLSMFGDGATVKKMPLMNILASGAHEPIAVMDIVDCTGHLEKGGKKDAKYIATCFEPHMKELDPEESKMDCVFFDGASNVQKAGRLLEAKFL